jgi:alpha-beta hydrolase superfamily lysophospholipase
MPDTVSAPFATTIETRGTRLRIVGRPLSAPRGGMIIVPGFAEHAGRWGRLMDDLAARGFASFVYEPRGHGGSSGPRGHTPSWQDLAEDLDAVVEVLEASGRLPARRVLLGASMGGLLVADWLPAHPERFHGLVLVAPFFAPALTSRVSQCMHTWIHRKGRQKTQQSSRYPPSPSRTCLSRPREQPSQKVKISTKAHIVAHRGTRDQVERIGSVGHFEKRRKFNSHPQKLQN